MANLKEVGIKIKYSSTGQASLDKADKALTSIDKTTDKISKKKIVPASAEGSLNKLQDQLKKVTGEYNRATVGSEKFIKKQKEIAELQKKINSAKGNDPKVVDDKAKAIQNLTDKFSGGAKEIPVFGEAISGVLTKLGPLGIGIGVAVTAITALGLHVLDVTKQMRDVNNQFDKLSDAGKDIDEISGRVITMEKLFGKSKEEIEQGAKALVTQFGIKGSEAIKLIEDGLTATNGKLDIQDVVEFSSAVKDAGGNAKDLIKNLSVSKQEGLMSNKSVDAIKSFTEFVNKADDATKDLLKSAKIDPKKIYGDLAKGTITQQELFKKVFKDIDKYDLKTQQALKDTLGGGKDIGNAGLKAISEFNGSMDELIQRGGKASQQAKELVDAENKLNTQKSKNVKELIPLLNKWDVTVIKIQTKFEEMLEPIITIFVKIGSILSKLTIVQVVVGAVVLAFKAVYGIVKIIFDAIAGVLTLIESIQIGLEKLVKWLSEKFVKIFDKIFGDGAFEKVKDFFTKIFDWVKKKFDQLGNFFKNIFEGINEGLKGNYDNAKNAFARAGNSFNSNASEKEKNEELKEKNEELIGAKDSLGKSVSNDVKGASSNVNNITLQLEALQKIQNQYIGSSSQAKEANETLTKGLIQTVNDVNQTAINY